MKLIFFESLIQIDELKSGWNYIERYILKLLLIIQDLVFSCVYLFTIIVLQINFWWFQKRKKKPPVGVSKTDVLFCGWCWHFHRYFLFTGVAQNARTIVFYCRSITNIKEQVNIPASLGMFYKINFLSRKSKNVEKVH